MGLVSSIFGVAAQGAGIGMQMAAAEQQQFADQMARQWNATIAQQDAQLSRISAEQTRKRGEVAATDKRREASILKGKQRAAYGASGVDVNWGSAAAVQADTMAWGEYEAQKELYNYGLEAWQHDVNALKSENEANRLRAGIGSTSTSSLPIAIAGAGSVFNSISGWRL